LGAQWSPRSGRGTGRIAIADRPLLHGDHLARPFEGAGGDAAEVLSGGDARAVLIRAVPAHHMSARWQSAIHQGDHVSAHEVTNLQYDGSAVL